MTDLELLAPARTADIGIAAIDCGADAVYIAGPEFGARQAAGNSIEDIGRLCEYAHKFGVRIFAALNTIIYDDEMDRACEMLFRLQDAGADAVIIQDAGLAMAVRSYGDGPKGTARTSGLKIPLHASTQCAIRTPEKAAFMESLGFSRLILERELSLDDIRAIRAAVSCELEFFVHGALCVCYSGQCYISENISGRSANRGACIQACRSLYDLIDETGRKLVSNKPLLSLKDLDLKNRLEDLAEAGVSSFKIEGRLKNMSYVKNVVRDHSLDLDALVRKYPEKYRRASFGRIAGGFIPAPDKTFNRGYTELYIDGKRGKWASSGAAKSMGETAGTVISVSPDFTAIRLRPATSSLKLRNGDGFCFVSNANEVIGFRGDVCDGMTIRCKPVPELKCGMTLYRNIDTAFEKELETDMPSRYMDVRLSVSGNVGILSVSAETADGRTWSGTLGENAEPAKNRDGMRKTVISQLSKSCGHYSFSVEEFSANGLPFLPMSVLNAFRRRIADELDRMPLRTRQLYGQDGNPEKACSFISGKHMSYKENISNGKALELFNALGAADVEPAYELEQKEGAELMRTKYCIRYQFGKCPKYHGEKWPEKLFLENNGRRFALHFDCRNCEMAIINPQSRT